MESTLVVFFSSYVGVSIMFIVSLYISQYFNSPRVFYFISIVSFISTILTGVLLKLQSPWFLLNSQAATVLGGFNILSALKYVELAFGYKWTYIRQIPLKLAVMYLIAFPRMPESEAKLSQLSRQNARRDGMWSVARSVCQFIILRSIIYLTPIEWFSLCSSSFPVIIRFLRYAVLSIVVYLWLDLGTTIGFAIHSIVFNIPMNSSFPSFPFIATSLRDFWSYRWNNLVKSTLHLMSFIILPKLINPIIPMNNTVRALFAFALSGFIHEYGLWFATSKWFGTNMIFFLIHGLLVLLEITVKVPARPNTLKGKLMGWIWTIGVLLITSPLFLDPMIEVRIFANMK